MIKTNGFFSDSQDFENIFASVPTGFLVCILFKVKTRKEFSFLKSHKGSLRKFCFEIGELSEVKWNIKIGETDETILNKGQTKGIVSIGFEDLISKIHSGKQYLLCNFLKT